MTKHKPGPSTGQKEAYLARLLDGLSPANQADVRRFIDEKRAEGLKVASLVNLTITLSLFDRFTNGQRLTEIAAERIVAFFAAHHNNRSFETLKGHKNAWMCGLRADGPPGLRWLLRENRGSRSQYPAC